MKKTAFIFAYKGNVAVEIDMDNGKFINDLTQPGQLGCVIDSKEVEITQEAKDIIFKAKREGGSFSELMLTEHADGSGSSIGVLGFGKCFLGKDFKIGRDCEKGVLEHLEVVDKEAPQDFQDFINSQEN